MGGIVGRTAVYIWSDTAMYTMKFIGPPLTFGFQQMGTNCGMSSQHAAAEVNGIAYWMGPTGFYKFDGGRVQLMPCLVEDYVFEDINANANQQVHVAVNALFGEITWFYPSSGSDYVDRSVTYNYLDSSPQIQSGILRHWLVLHGALKEFSLNLMQRNLKVAWLLRIPRL